MTQDQALAILESGASVLLTGAAGTGKTFVLNKFIRRAKRAGKSVAVTATTGLAATHLNGTTIHAWSGIGVHDSLDKYAAAKLGKGRQDLIRKAEVLVIDEISMLHDFRLDMVDQILRMVRGSAEPFGGVQVILCGDFFQLPPVNRRDSRQGSFVITSDAWQQGAFTVCYLEKQYRQTNDQDYTDILNGIRKGYLTRSQLDALRARTQGVEDPFATLFDKSGKPYHVIGEQSSPQNAYPYQVWDFSQIENKEVSCVLQRQLKFTKFMAAGKRIYANYDELGVWGPSYKYSEGLYELLRDGAAQPPLKQRPRHSK